MDPSLDAWDTAWRERLHSRWPAVAGILLMRLAQVWTRNLKGDRHPFRFSNVKDFPLLLHT